MRPDMWLKMAIIDNTAAQGGYTLNRGSEGT